MAFIEKFLANELERNSIHEGIDAKYTIFQRDGRSFLQIDTHGRSTREVPGKKSQTIQLDKNSGRELFEILKRAFNF